jgi:glycosyltransferase involved in cell wall biosynthesis
MSILELEKTTILMRSALHGTSRASLPRQELSVLHVINGEHFSGAERVQQLLGKRLPEYGVAADFACLKAGKFASHCDLPPDRVFTVPMKGRFDREIAGRVINLVEAGGYDLLHAHTPRSAMITSRVASRLGLPWVYHVHSPTARDSSRRFINQINDLIERWSLRNCTQLITVSRSLRREFLRRGFDRQQLACVPNGVPELPAIDPWSRVEDNTWRLGMIALFRPRKGLEVLLEALHRLPSQTPNIELEVIGGFETTEYENAIMKLVDEFSLHSKVRFTGFTKDVASRIANLDGLVLPSLYGEGMPMVVLEALSAGVPVVATRVEGTPEVVRDGVEGVLAEPQSPESLAQAIVRFTQDRGQWAQFSIQALARHREKYSDRQMAAATGEVYRRILSNLPGHQETLSLFCG